MRKIEGIQILNVEIVFHCIVQANLYDLGAVTLVCEDRNFILDIESVQIYEENNHTTMVCNLVVDEDTFQEGENFHLDGDSILNYKLEAADFQNSKLRGTVYVGGEYETEPDSQTLFVKHINNEGTCGMTQAIEIRLNIKQYYI